MVCELSNFVCLEGRSRYFREIRDFPVTMKLDYSKLVFDRVEGVVLETPLQKPTTKNTNFTIFQAGS